MARVSCPPDEVLACYVEDVLFLEERERVEEHVASCEDCLTVLAESVRFRGGEVADAQELRFVHAFRAAWCHLAALFAREGPQAVRSRRARLARSSAASV